MVSRKVRKDRRKERKAFILTTLATFMHSLLREPSKAKGITF